ncbi:hypothetical protein [Citricoccus alkalitolerans]|uniref:Uncharacterized protein n=1 Tax=Citricoccus alkalitolerans TaxID=246603 RepID=A0ABV8Y1X1_9MICC
MNTSDLESDLTRSVEQDRALYAAGYRAGLEQGRTEVSCAHIHPEIAASVAEMFPDWDGATAAQRRSIIRFRHEQHQGVKV